MKFILASVHFSYFQTKPSDPIPKWAHIIVELCSAFRVLKKDLAIQCFQFPQQASRFSCRTSVFFGLPTALYMEWSGILVP